MGEQPKAGELWHIRFGRTDDPGEGVALCEGGGWWQLQGDYEPGAAPLGALMSCEVTPIERIPTAAELAAMRAELERLRRDRSALLAFLRDRQRMAVAGGDDYGAEIMLGFLRGFERDEETPND